MRAQKLSWVFKCFGREILGSQVKLVAAPELAEAGVFADGLLPGVVFGQLAVTPAQLGHVRLFKVLCLVELL